MACVTNGRIPTEHILLANIDLGPTTHQRVLYTKILNFTSDESTINLIGFIHLKINLVMVASNA